MSDSIDPCERKIFSLISAQEWHMNQLYSEYTNEFGTILRNYNGRLSQARKQELDRALQRFHDDLEALFIQQITRGVDQSNACTDDFIKDYLQDMDMTSEQVNTMLMKNEGATMAFINRKVKGLGLSDRVWKLTRQTQENIDLLLESGVVNGRSAPEMATDLKKFLKEPNRRFRRIRDENGKLQLSKPARRYHPGRGVYRSSYKNALRMSRTEVNMAYRDNDFQRRQNLPFIVGQRISLSPSHPEPDICNELVGLYPKEFRFLGYHPQCLCLSTSVRIPRNVMKNYLAGEPIPAKYQVKGMPKRGLNFLNKNAEQIKGWANTPYFIRDNFTPTKTGFKLNETIPS